MLYYTILYYIIHIIYIYPIIGIMVIFRHLFDLKKKSWVTYPPRYHPSLHQPQVAGFQREASRLLRTCSTWRHAVVVKTTWPSSKILFFNGKSGKKGGLNMGKSGLAMKSRSNHQNDGFNVFDHEIMRLIGILLPIRQWIVKRNVMR